MKKVVTILRKISFFSCMSLKRKKVEERNEKNNLF